MKLKKMLTSIIATAVLLGSMGLTAFAEDSAIVAKVGTAEYTDIQEAIREAAPNGTVEIEKDITVEEWKQFQQGDSSYQYLIYINMNGLTINGNNHTLTVNNIISGSNGNRLFSSANNINISDLTINQPDGLGGISLKSGKFENVTFNSGNGIFPGDGDITINKCTFKTDGYCIYSEEENNGLKVTNNTIDIDEGKNVIFLRGNTEFTGNEIVSGGKTRIVSGSPTVSGNSFGDTIVKVYNDATAKIENNSITNIEIDDETKPVSATFAGNELSAEAYEKLSSIDDELVENNTVISKAKVYEVKNDAELAEAIKAVSDGDTIKLAAGNYTGDLIINKAITVEGEIDTEGNNLVNISGKLSITADDAKTKNININNSGSSAGCISAKNVTVEGCSVVGGNGFRYCYTSGTVTFKDSIITGSTYGIHFDGSSGGEIIIDNCVITGWTSFASTIKKVTISGTEFAEGNYNKLRLYQNAEISNSVFNPEMSVDFGKDEVELAITDCTVSDNSPITDIIYLPDIAGMGIKVTIDDEPVVLESSVTDADNNTTYYLELAEALNAAVTAKADVTVNILDNIDLRGVDWEPVVVDGAAGAGLITVEGNEKTVTGLNDMLFSGTWAGKSGLIIKNLTIANSTIIHDENDESGNIGVGAFVGYPQASETITLSNCHLKNSTVKGGHWTGGLIGMAGGYNGNDGPVFMNLTIENCSVTDSTITGKGSAGGIIGHGSCAAWTNVGIKDVTVTGNTITSTGDSNEKAGSVCGTVGAAGQPTEANGEIKIGGLFVDANINENLVTSNGTTITTIYGRQGTSTGILEITGGTYDAKPINEAHSWAGVKEGYELKENIDGTYEIVKADLPSAEVKNLGAITVTPNYVYNGSLTQGKEPIDLQIAMEFVAKDTPEQAAKNPFGEYTTDFFIEISNLSSGGFDATGCYLAGHYGDWGWVQVPLDGMTVENGKIYPVITSVGFDFSYVDICTSVKDFKCGIYLTEKVLEENPNLEVKLTLGLSKDKESALATDFITVDEAKYVKKDFGKKVCNWVKENDAGFYIDGETKYGMIRFLFAADVYGEIEEYGIKYSKADDITEDITADGKTTSAIGNTDAFYGDLIGISENSSTTYYASAFIKVDGEYLWSEVANCSPNWKNNYTGYTGGTN